MDSLLYIEMATTSGYMLIFPYLSEMWGGAKSFSCNRIEYA